MTTAPTAPPRPTTPRRTWPDDQSVRDAVHTVTDLRCYGPAWSATELAALQRSDPGRFIDMTIALAALVPAERSIDTLLSWTMEAPPMPEQPDTPRPADA